MSRGWTWVVRASLAAVAVLVCGGASATAAAPPVSIRTLSNRADLISGGDALVAIDLANGVKRAGLGVTLNGSDVTSDFAPRPTEGGRIEGVVEGLRVGANSLTARLPDGRGARLTIVDHPIGGPVFSGPQIKPWYCLAGALDDQCDRDVTYTYSYKSSTTGQFDPYDPSSPPTDVATTTTDQGKTVPYIVRLETGNLDRSQYRIAVLADPSKPFDRWTGPAAWNHKVIVPHGAGCAMGHSEGNAPDVMLDAALSKGFAVMSAALEHATENCNEVVGAESVMMTKEHLIERYGDIRYVIGVGCSGGSHESLAMANAFPGLYDGLIEGCTFPDAMLPDPLDCVALVHYWESPTSWAPGVLWAEPEEAAATGMGSTTGCHAYAEVPDLDFAKVYDPTVGVQCDVDKQEPAKVYNPATNPDGVRCSFQDYLVNILGLRTPDRWGAVEKQIGHGFANRAYDNVGVQYGLRALQAGSITPAQFVDLNAKIGSVDIDYGIQPSRVSADPGAIAAAYRSGLVNETNNLDRVPIIDIPVPADHYEIHNDYMSWALSARMDEFNGQHGNHVIWYGPDSNGQVHTQVGATAIDKQALAAMDEWLSAIEQDHRDTPLASKVVADRPAAASDKCELPDRATCDKLFGPDGNIRWAAGGSIANDVVKRRLKPLVRSDYYPVTFTDDEWTELEQAFPSGVCDYSRRGVDQQGAAPWQTYLDGAGNDIPGGRPLGSPPASQALAGG